MIGIYKITNKKNGKVYIGQSANIERRFKEHCHQNKSRISVDKAIFDEGIENFSFEVVEVCSIEELNDKETFWIGK
jgi:group I intron endonuclease